MITYRRLQRRWLDESAEFLADVERITQNETLFVETTTRRNELDPTAVRSGRVVRELQFGMPAEETRVAMLKQPTTSRTRWVKRGKQRPRRTNRSEQALAEQIVRSLVRRLQSCGRRAPTLGGDTTGTATSVGTYDSSRTTGTPALATSAAKVRVSASRFEKVL